MVDPFPHESRFRATLVVSGVSDKAFNRPQPVRNLQVDLDVSFDAVPHLFGPLAPHLVGRRVLVEHESGLPSRRSALRMLMKLLAAIDDHKPARSRTTPLLVVLCRQGPGGLRRLVSLKSTDEAGILRGAAGFARSLWVVDGAKLPPSHGYAGLRFMLCPDPEPTNYLAELLGDATLPTLLRQRLEKATMNHEIPASEPERLTAWERAQREGEARGEARGRRALLSLATRLVGPEFAAELDAVESLEAIERAIEERLAERQRQRPPLTTTDSA